MAAAVHSSASDSTESVPAVQVYCTPNFGCHIRVSLATGAPEYGAYMKSASGCPAAHSEQLEMAAWSFALKQGIAYSRERLQ